MGPRAQPKPTPGPAAEGRAGPAEAAAGAERVLVLNGGLAGAATGSCLEQGQDTGLNVG